MLVKSFKVFKYMYLIIRKEKINLKENWLIFWRIWGEAELFLGILGEKAKYFQGAEKFIFRDLEIDALFLGSKGASTANKWSYISIVYYITR